MALLATAVALVTTSCLRAETTIRVDDDGSGEIDSLLALDIDAALELNEAFEVEGAAAVSTDELCTQFEQDQVVPDGATVTPYREDGFCGLRYRLEFGPGQLGEVMAEADSGDFELRREGDGWYFAADVADGAAGGDDLTEAFFGDELFGEPEVSLGVLLPGRLVEHNATYIDTDGTAVWEIDLADPIRTISARTEPGERVLGQGRSGNSGNTLAVVFTIAILLAIVGGALWLIGRRRRQRADAAAAVLAGGTGEGPPGGPPGSAPQPRPPRR